MTQGLFLDTLNPPAPAQLVADLAQVGAVAVGLYVLRRDAAGNLLTNGDWTPAHVGAVLAARKAVLPIVVPGNNPLASDVGLALDNASAIGCPVGPIVVDLETWSLPAGNWVASFIDGGRARGWRVLRYGDVAVLADYPGGDGDWVSHGYIAVRENQLFPVPLLPQVPGVVADQYTVGVVVNGSDYDGSVFDESVFPVPRGAPDGGDMAIARRTDGSGLVDWFEVAPDRSCYHYVLTAGQSVPAAEPIGGGGFVPNSLVAWWNDAMDTLTVMGQVADGTWWAAGWHGSWGSWLPTGVSTALPAPVPAQPDDDSALAGRIATLESDLADIKAAIK